MAEAITERHGLATEQASEGSHSLAARDVSEELSGVILESFLGMPALIASGCMRQLYRVVEQIAPSLLSVLIIGESGTGKELVARAVHQRSPRARLPWIDVNCAALPEHLFESELFGYEKGAFSGANSSKPGLLELAHTGTLFLDEVGELPLEIQVKLLRVLDGAAYFRLGGTKKINLDVRIVAATNQDLERAVAAGKFRLDLFHRLAQIQLTVPPLRERSQDILPLSEFFLTQQPRSLRLSEKAAASLERRQWLGNVRELRNVILRAALLASGGTIEIEDLGPETGSVSRTIKQEAANSPVAVAATAGQRLLRLDDVERTTILAAMQQAAGSRTEAAALLGISVKTLGRKLKSYEALSLPQPHLASERENRNSCSSIGMHIERRRQLRQPATGTTFLQVEGDVSRPQHVATLCDVSSTGFRATHDNFNLAAGDTLVASGVLGRQRARVVWTRIVDGRSESGFTFLPPLERNLA